MFSWF